MADDLNKKDMSPEPAKNDGQDTARTEASLPDGKKTVSPEPVKSITQEPVRRETSLLVEKKPHPLMPSDESGARPQTARLAPPWRLLLQIGGQTQTTVGIEVKDRIVLGRSDPVANFYPDLDLSPYGGQEGGVSRRHAVIIQDDDNKAIYLEDLNSTNGTRINGFSLEPHRRYRLRDGDDLEFGRVRVTLRFVRSPYQ